MKILMVMVMLLSGCAIVKLKTETIDFRYYRLFNQKLHDVQGIKTEDGWKVNLGDQRANHDEFIKALNEALKLIN